MDLVELFRLALNVIANKWCGVSNHYNKEQAKEILKDYERRRMDVGYQVATCCQTALKLIGEDNCAFMDYVCHLPEVENENVSKL